MPDNGIYVKFGWHICFWLNTMDHFMNGHERREVHSKSHVLMVVMALKEGKEYLETLFWDTT